MTKLDWPVRRELRKTVRDGGERPLIVELRPPGILHLRAKGLHSRYTVSLTWLYHQAVMGKVPSPAACERHEGECEQGEREREQSKVQTGNVE